MPNALAVLVGRILLSIVFLVSGFQGLTNLSDTAGYFASLGLPVPAITAWAVVLFEVVAGLAVLVGFMTRIAAALLAAFCIAAGYIGHYGQGGGDPMLALMHTQAFMKDLGLAGAFLVLAVFGPGSLSVDGRQRSAA
jgi:putative oxidoreductase